MKKVDAYDYDVLDRVWVKPAKGDAQIWMQWKGTDVCCDFNCACGFCTHVCGVDFLYLIRCPKCKATYALNPNIELVQVSNAEGLAAVILEPEDDDA